jgi:hypothetical protein
MIEQALRASSSHDPPQFFQSSLSKTLSTMSLDDLLNTFFQVFSGILFTLQQEQKATYFPFIFSIKNMGKLKGKRFTGTH